MGREARAGLPRAAASAVGGKDRPPGCLPGLEGAPPSAAGRSPRATRDSRWCPAATQLARAPVGALPGAGPAEGAAGPAPPRAPEGAGASRCGPASGPALRFPRPPSWGQRSPEAPAPGAWVLRAVPGSRQKKAKASQTLSPGSGSTGAPAACRRACRARSSRWSRASRRTALPQAAGGRRLVRRLSKRRPVCWKVRAGPQNGGAAGKTWENERGQETPEIRP